MKKMSVDQMAMIEGGQTRTQRNLGCAAMGLAAGIASLCNPLVGALTTLGCMYLTPYKE